MADESQERLDTESDERLHEVPKVERAAHRDGEAAKAADHLAEPRPDVGEVAPPTSVEEKVSVKIDPDFPVEGTSNVAVGGYPDVKLYEGKGVKLDAGHATALVNAGIAVRTDS